MRTEPNTLAHGGVPSALAEEPEVGDKTPDFPSTGKVGTGPTGSEKYKGDKRKHRQGKAEAVHHVFSIVPTTHGSREAGHTVPIRPTQEPLAKKCETGQEGHCGTCIRSQRGGGGG